MAKNDPTCSFSNMHASMKRCNWYERILITLQFLFLMCTRPISLIKLVLGTLLLSNSANVQYFVQYYLQV